MAKNIASINNASAQNSEKGIFIFGTQNTNRMNTLHATGDEYVLFRRKLEYFYTFCGILNLFLFFRE